MQNLIFLDLETTGLDTEKCEIIEVAYYASDNSFDISANRLFKPTSITIPPEVSGVTNIDEADVIDCPHFVDSEIAKNLKSYAEDGYIAVTHNTDFDLSVLEAHGIKFKHSVCTYKLAWKYLPELANHKLGTLRANFGIPHTGEAHRAAYDVDILMKVYEKLSSLVIGGNTYSDEREPIIDLIKASDQAKTEYQDISQFGKYKGQKISEIADRDPGYLSWLLKNTEDQKLKSYIRAQIINL